MNMHVLERTQRLPIPIDQAWDFFSNPRNLSRITPPEMGFELLTDPPARMHGGMLVIYRVRPLLKVPVTWVTEITHVEEPHRFVDEQRFGPYRFWHHLHEFREIHDLVHYALRPGGGAVRPLLVAPRLEAIFDFRSRTLEEMFGPYREPSETA
jgi:ligand-binding SRPBCC domain-containing protein